MSTSLRHRLATLLGFSKFYNASLFLLTAIPLVLFALSQLLQCFTFHGIRVSQTAPGEAYWFRSGYRRLGIQIHLAAVLPCALLAVLQFVPALRRARPGFHRVNGRVVLVLLLVANVGALMIARHAFGGTIDVQTIVGFLALITTTSAALAWYSIRRVQIDQHRAWMLRAFFYMGTILTARVVIVVSAVIISRIGGYRNIWPCETIEWTWRYYGVEGYLDSYPLCADQDLYGAFAPVLANLLSKTDPAQIGASLQIPTGMAFWISLMLNGVGVEIYLALTPREAMRLRVESWRRQKDAGYEEPRSGGLVIERLGDAETWTCPNLGKVDSAPGEEGTEEREGLLG